MAADMFDDDSEDTIILTERELAIAKKAARLAIEQVYTEIGKSVVRKFFWIMGAVAVAALVWLSKTGRI